MRPTMMRCLFPAVLCCAGVALTVPGCGAKPAPAQAEEQASSGDERVALNQSPPDRVGEAPFKFPPGKAGELLREQLTPGRNIRPEPLPPVTEPRPERGAGLSQRAGRPELPPALDKHGPPRALPSERATAQSHRPGRDLPPLAAESTPAPPEHVMLPAGPRAFAGALNPGQPPLTELTAPQPRSLVEGDPTIDWSRRAALSVLEAFRTRPAPFLRFSIPDPLELLRTARLRDPPAEGEPPLNAPLRPPLPPLPAK